MGPYPDRLHLLRGLAAFAAGTFGSGCSELTYLPGDWELDVVAELPAEAEQLRICVDGVGVTTLGAGNGRAAVRGLPPDPVDVRVEVYDIENVALFSTPWLTVSDEEPTVSAPAGELGSGPCAAAGGYVEPGSDDRLLVVRFIQE
ncbi:hypothetical protein LBMAG42_11350 [Deltaproteobacteria bacterium]|nr:hypothetical protein LBMAG42_11350 [Deltaproteobacteria bacterium]